MAFARADPGPLWRRRLEAGAKEARAQEAQPEEPGETGAPARACACREFSTTFRQRVDSWLHEGAAPACLAAVLPGLDSWSPDTTTLGACCLSTNGVDSAEALF